MNGKIIVFAVMVCMLIVGNIACSQTVDDIKRKLNASDKPVKNKLASDEFFEEKGFSSVIGKHYIVHVKDMSRQEADLILRHMERILEEYLKLFEYPFGTQKCFVRVYGKEKDFKSLGRSRGKGEYGAVYYSNGINNYIETFNSPSLYPALSHEAFHQFIEKAFKKKPPVWFNEGMASYYEPSTFVNDKFVTGIVNKDMLFIAKASIDSKVWAGIKKLIALDYDGFYGGNMKINYSSSWCLIYFLTNKNRDAFKGFVSDIRMRKSFATAVRTNYKINVKQLEKELKNYIKSLPGV